MKYIVTIEKPETHIVSVQIDLGQSSKNKDLDFFLPSWSPGSYLMREYSRHVRSFMAFDKLGERLSSEQIEKGKWRVSSDSQPVQIRYEIYAHELTVRTSFVDESHAFLHGPSYLMGLENEEFSSYEIEFRFPPLWSKLSTGLKDISSSREIFLYTASSYDELIDAPVEIGCHETDGFMAGGKEHELAFYGRSLNTDLNLKDDIKTIVEFISTKLGQMPYDRYLFISHFVPGLYGGLEHLNSTALQFDETQLRDRDSYINWLSLVAHEYFHTWNVKRIRPIELGPFKYTEENYTKMLWLAEGLTSFMDDLFVYQAGLCTLEEYLKVICKNLQLYYSIPGKKFDSLESSSFNAWIKLYRPDENSRNSTISYYLKGGLVFFALNALCSQHGSTMYDLIKLLWDDYSKHPERGVTKDEVLAMVEQISDKAVAEEFDTMLSTTFDIDFEKMASLIGLEFVWETESSPGLGFDLIEKEGKLFISRVELDSPAYKAGFNAGDELLALNNLRFQNSWKAKIGKMLEENKSYQILVSRKSTVMTVPFIPGKPLKKLQEIKVKSQDLAEKSLLMADKIS